MPPTNGSSVGMNHLGVNLAFTKFLFVSPREDDDRTRTRVRQTGACIARGFFNDFDAESEHDAPPHETIQFLVSNGTRAEAGLGAARHVVQICSKYRPRLEDVEAELGRRLGDTAHVTALDGAIRVPQYTSAELHAYAYRRAMTRTTGRLVRNAIIIPVRKTPEWWALDPLDRHSYFYPSRNGYGPASKGHARAAEAGITTIYRQIYYYPDGRGTDGQFDFISYFECADEHLPTFDAICENLRDVGQNPEWRFVEEGPEWRGYRVLRW
jgi:hypothetical protein